jgi:IS30 family transposase
MTSADVVTREERRAAIYSLRSEGLTMAAIADTLSVSHRTVSQTLKLLEDPAPPPVAGWIYRRRDAI